MRLHNIWSSTNLAARGLEHQTGKRPSTLRPEAFPTLHALATQNSEGALDYEMLEAAHEEARPNKGLAARLQLVAEYAGDRS